MMYVRMRVCVCVYVCMCVFMYIIYNNTHIKPSHVWLTDNFRDQRMCAVFQRHDTLSALETQFECA